MRTTDMFDPTIADWLRDDAEHRVPDHLTEVLGRTGRTRQRPWWSSLERWLPVQASLRLLPAPRVAWLLVLIALIVALAAAVLLVGSHPRPAPFTGLARNGDVLYAKDGDIYRVDRNTGATKTIVAGSTRDASPYFSADGLHIVFLRLAADSAGSDLASVAVADADGTNVRVLTEPLREQTWFDWSADGLRLAEISTIDGMHALTIVNADGSGTKTLNLGMHVDFVGWRGPKGDELIFRGRSLTAPATRAAGLYAVRPDGTGLHQLVPGLGDEIGAYQVPMVSPDGSHVLYTSFEQTNGLSPDGGKPDIAWDGMGLRIHILDLVTGKDTGIPVGTDPSDTTLPMDQGYGVFSPDGSLIMFKQFTNDGQVELAVAPADGSAPGKRLGPTTPKILEFQNFGFSPDGSAAIVPYPGERVVRVLPLDGSPGSTLPWNGGETPSMQRLAP